MANLFRRIYDWLLRLFWFVFSFLLSLFVPQLPQHAPSDTSGVSLRLRLLRPNDYD